MRSSNPVFKSIERTQEAGYTGSASYAGIIIKTAIMFAIAIASGFFAVSLVGSDVQTMYGLLIASVFIAFIAALIGTLSIRLSMVFSIIYAIAEGFLLGVLTLVVNIYVPGAGITAVIGTGSIFLVMLFLYSSRTIRVTPRFRRIMYTILIGILLSTILFGLLSLLGVFDNMTGDYFGIAIAISVFLIIYGAIMLTLDFDRAEQIVSSGADKRYEWQVSLGLMITVVWIYVEILRLILIIASRKD